MFKKLFLYLVITLMILGLSSCTENQNTSGSVDNNDQGQDSSILINKLPEFNGFGNTASNLMNDGIAASYEGYAYHSDRMIAGNIWRTSKETGESEAVIKGRFYSINVNKGYMFMSGREANDVDFYAGREGLFLMNIENKALKLIKEGTYNCMTLYNNWIYYIDDMEGGLYRIRPDGSEDTLLFKDIYEVFAIANDQIYFQTYLLDSDDYSYIYTLPLEGGKPKKLIEDALWGGDFALGDGYIYYLSYEDSSEYYRIDLEGNHKTSSFNFHTSDINITKDYIYYCVNSIYDVQVELGIYRMDLDGRNNELFHPGNDLFAVNVAGGYVFWHTNDDMRRMTMTSEAGGKPCFVREIIE